MTSITLDISDDQDDESPLEIAPDVSPDCYQATIGPVVLTINYDQMQRLYGQLRPWFEDDAQ